MLKYGNKEFRNLEEQVAKNKQDIEALINGSGIEPVVIHGPAGPQGETGETGVGITDIVNVNGDLYITTSDGKQYALGNVIGPQGPMGLRGPQGLQGKNGTNGTNGENMPALIIRGTKTGGSIPDNADFNTRNYAWFYRENESDEYHIWLNIYDTISDTYSWTDSGSAINYIDAAGTAVYVNGNKVLSFDADTKLDKRTNISSYDQTYGKSADGSVGMFNVSMNDAGAGTIARRNTSGRLSVIAPESYNDTIDNDKAVNKEFVKDYVTSYALQRKLGGTDYDQVYAKGVNGNQININATTEAVAKSLIYRDSNGTAKVSTPTNDEDIANKAYVDAEIEENTLNSTLRSYVSSIYTAGVNLFNVDTYKPRLLNGIRSAYTTNTAANSITIQLNGGTADNYMGNITSYDSSQTGYIPVNANTNYTLSGRVNTNDTTFSRVINYVGFYKKTSSGMQFISFMGIYGDIGSTSFSNTFTTPSLTAAELLAGVQMFIYIRFGISLSAAGSTSTYIFNNIRLNIGSSDLGYSSYNGNILRTGVADKIFKSKANLPEVANISVNSITPSSDYQQITSITVPANTLMDINILLSWNNVSPNAVVITDSNSSSSIVAGSVMYVGLASAGGQVVMCHNYTFLVSSTEQTYYIYGRWNGTSGTAYARIQTISQDLTPIGIYE